MSKKAVAAFVIAFVLLFGLGMYFSAVPSGREACNNYEYSLQKADDVSRYATRKEVEGTCRAMIVSYTADVLIYEQYKGDTDAEKQGWAEQAKMRANKTAATYNEYILRNSFIFQSNVPSDIREQLEFIQ